MNTTISLPGLGPIPAVRPTNVLEAGQIIRDARSRQQAIYPVGGQTMLDVGRAPSRSGIAIDLTAMNGVIDYPARDMTITVQAGITIAALRDILSRENQWLPIDVPHPDRATIGGAVATNTSGAHRYGHGTLRDAVIGISFLADDGVEVKGGGRVVKNVAGYDLMKLQTGALGTLGVITQLTLKVKPRPESSAIVAFGCTSNELPDVLDRLHRSKSRPEAIELLNLAAWKDLGQAAIPGDWVIVVGFGEKRVTLDWQKTTLLAEIQRSSVEFTGLWQSIADLQVRSGSQVIGKASIRPSQVAEFLNRINMPDQLIHGQPLNGIVWLHPAGAIGPEFMLRRGGASVPRTGADWDLMKHIKATLDPENLFNPGRLW